jgi:hypothetical protein
MEQETGVQMAALIGTVLGFVFFFGFIIAFVFIVFYFAKKQKQKQDLMWQQWALSRGLEYVADTLSAVPAQSSFSVGTILRRVRGTVPEAGNSFEFLHQSEVRGSGKSRREYKRSLLGVDIPDTQLQLIINSKINNDANSGGNLAAYKNKQRFSLEGDFGTFFDLYMPDTTQSETLSMLTPDSMLFVLREMAEYDIEINGAKLYLYTYRHLTTSEVEMLLGKLPTLLREMRLRKEDTRTEKITNALVARTATDSVTQHRRLKKDAGYLTGAFILLVFAFQFTANKYVAFVMFAVMAGIFVKATIDWMQEARLKRKYKEVLQHYR